MKQSIPFPQASGFRALAKTILLGLVLVAIGRWLVTPACGAIVPLTWNGGTSWSAADNWDPPQVPQNGENLRFITAGGAFTDSDPMVNNLPDLTVRSMFFSLCETTLQIRHWWLSGNTLGITDYIQFDGCTDFRVFISCGLRLEGDVRIMVKAGADFDPSWEIHLDGPIDLNGHNLQVFVAGARISVDISGAISGNGNIVLSGASGGSVRFSGTEPNTFQGTLTVADSCTFILSKQTGVAAVSDTARLVVEAGGVAQLNSSEQIGDNADVEIHSGGQFRLESFIEAIGNLILLDNVESGDNRPPVVDTGSRLLALNGSLTCSRNSSNFQDVPTIRGVLNLNGFIPITVTGSPDPGLDITASIVGNGFDKLGAGTLRLSGVNSFIGDVAVTEGTIEAHNQSAFAPGGPPSGVHLNGGNILLQNIPIPAEPLFVNSSSSLLTAIGQCSWDGPITLNATLNVVALDPTFSNVPFNISSSISGTGGLDLLSPLFGVGNVRLSGNSANTFTGPLTVNCQLLELDKPSGVKAYAGPLIVGQAGVSALSEARWLQDYQNVQASVTVEANGLVNLNNHHEDFGLVTFNGGHIDTGAAGDLSVYNTVTVNPTSQPARISGRLGIPPAVPTAGVFVVQDTPDLFDLWIDAVVFGGGGIDKRGLGNLLLDGANTYSGQTMVREGLLVANRATSLGARNVTSVRDGATLWLVNLDGPIAETITLEGAGYGGLEGALKVTGNASLATGFPSIFECLQVGSNATIRVEPGSALTVDGFISGTGPLIKTFGGTLVFANANANTYTGDTMINQGTLELRKPNNSLSVPGNLILGPAPAISPAVARLFQTGALGANSSVTAGANSLFDLNGNNQTLAQLRLNDGGNVQTGAGRLNFPGGAIVQVGSLSPSGSHVSSSITGNIGLPPNDSITFSVGPYAFFFPFDARPELDVPAVISVNGFENVNFAPAGFSKNGLGRMRLAGNNTHRGFTFAEAGTLQVDGVQPQSAVGVGAGARLQGVGTVGHVFVNGNSMVAPGDSPGILTCSNFNAGASGNGILQVELNGASPGSGYDQVNARGTVRLTGVTLNASLGFVSTVGQQFVIINNDGADAVTGTFTGLPQNASLYIGGEQFTISYTGGTGNDVVLTRLVTPPKPSLTIERVPPASVRLLWPTNAAGFALQSNTNLNTANWAAAPAVPASVVGTNNVALDSTTNIQTFYRLFHP